MIARTGTTNGGLTNKQTFVGTDCSGSDGDANRVLTLNNTSLTTTVIVALDTHLIEDDQYTVSHKASGTTITFVIKVWDSQKGEVLYD